MTEATLTSTSSPSDARESLTGAQLAIAALEAHGVDTIFGIPGVHTLALYDALRTSSIRHVLARHEQGAGFMADGYARASGRPGVACVITGPGVTNIATPIGEAYTDSSPVLVISSNNPRPHLDAMRGNLHDLKDQLGVMAAVTKWNTRVMDVNSVTASVAEAFQRMESGRPLPVHLEFPLDVLDEPATSYALPVARPAAMRPDPELLKQAADRLASARKIVIYCGGGAIHGNASESILAIAEALNAPVLTSFMGKGSVPEDHPLCVGALWEPGNAVDDLVQDADCMLVFGSKLGAQATQSFNMRFPAELIRIDVDERELHLNAAPTLGILGDAGLAAEGIAALLAGGEIRSQGFDRPAVGDARARAEATAWHAERRSYVDALRQAIPRDGILVTDMTQMSYVGCYLYPVYEPRSYMFPSGYGTLGFSMPAAIGAKIARPDAAVVPIVGDGGYQFTMSELGTAVQERLGLPIVIFNDSTYSAVKEAQSDSRGARYIGVDLVNPDYVDLAKAYRIPGVHAHSPEQLVTEIGAALQRDLPTIIDVPIEPWV
ncbi:MAG: 5-guanidino-2-oxopentanoate decarboxylase [Thermomicrobiales bacterium]|nr:5-guanidino-2-oxopentanoate decarboxylase [Thermomicrobiales bacterium]